MKNRNEQLSKSATGYERYKEQCTRGNYRVQCTQICRRWNQQPLRALLCRALNVTTTNTEGHVRRHRGLSVEMDVYVTLNDKLLCKI